MITAIEFRRHLHRHPELSFEEAQTAQYIEQCLAEAGISHSRIAETGVLAKIEGKGTVELPSIASPEATTTLFFDTFTDAI